MTELAPGDRDGVRVHDIEVAGTRAYLVEPTPGGSGSGILFGVRDAQAAADRAAFLGPILGWADA